MRHTLILPRPHGTSLGRLPEGALLARLARLPERALLACLPSTDALYAPNTKRAQIRAEELPLVIVSFLIQNADPFLITGAGNADNEQSPTLGAASKTGGVCLRP